MARQLVAAHLTAVPNGAPGPRRQGAPAEERRQLGVIEGGLGFAARLLRFLGTTLLVTFIIGLVGALVLHATIIENQRDLDAQRSDIRLLAAETEAMRTELAELEAPARIVDEARRLGMIEAPSIVYLNAHPGELGERELIVASNYLRANE